MTSRFSNALLASVLTALIGCSDKSNSDSETTTVDTTETTGTPGGDDTTDPTDDTAITGTGVGLVFDGDRPKNLLIIGVDTLRRDHVGYYNSEKKGTTDFLDALFAESVVLMDHRACSNWTYVSSVCLLSGNTGMDLGWIPNLDSPEGGGFERISLDTPLLPDMLEDKGFQIRLAGTGLFAAPGFNIIERFDHVTTDKFGVASDATNAALTQLNEAMLDDAPWFIMSHWFDPHMPYRDTPLSYLDELEALPEIAYPVSTEWLARDLHNIWGDLSKGDQQLILDYIDVYYRAEIRYTDDEIERLWGEMEAMGALDDTLVVFWSDHGEQFFEHDDFEHGKSLYGEETRASLAFWAKNLQPAEITTPTAHVDVLPTVFSAMDLGAPERASSGSIVGNSGEERVRFSYSGRHDLSIVGVDYSGERLIYHWNGAREYYVDDETESTDLFTEDSEGAAALWELLEPEVMKAYEAMEGAPEPNLP